MRKREDASDSGDNRKTEKYYCSVCGREISREDYEDFDGLCWECWDDQLTEEVDSTEGNDEEFAPM